MILERLRMRVNKTLSRPFVAGNWKMNGLKSSVTALLEGVQLGMARLSDIDWAVFPPFVYIDQCHRLLYGSDMKWGAQTVSEHFDDGAYTGEVSANMLCDFGCYYVLLGHSERRHLYGECNEVIARKIFTVLQADLVPILCVGETDEQYRKGMTDAVIEEQLAVIFKMNENVSFGKEMIIAYEPVWAIGTGRFPNPEEVQRVHAGIRTYWLSQAGVPKTPMLRVIYGGSVTHHNAHDFFMMPDIDGFLVGGASLKAESFLEIGNVCSQLS